MARAPQAVAQDFCALRRFVYDEDAPSTLHRDSVPQIACQPVSL
jgi:hypothetical protein